MISRTEYDRLAREGYNRIPLQIEVLADLETPVSAYLKMAQGPYSYLLESVQGGEKWGRYSIIGLPCPTVVRVSGDLLLIEQEGEEIHRQQTEDPLAAIQSIHRQFNVPQFDTLPRFNGGLVGYFSYDTVRFIEPHLAGGDLPDPVGAPDILLMVSDELLVFDNLSGRLHIVVHTDPESDDAYVSGCERLDQLVEQISSLSIGHSAPAGQVVRESDFRSSFVREDFEDAVERCKEYIQSGDIFQVVLSQRLSIPFEAEPITLYRALRTVNPSPYMYFLDLDDFQIVGSSPEILARLEEGEVTVRPIAGTRRRGLSEEEDRRLEEELISDPKELAEHLMLVDLGRNDVGRIAATGTVKLTSRMQVERYSHVMHIVSNVTGELQADLDAIDVLRATFPAGTVSGAPKVRAMEIIGELEPVRRGIYSGAVGYIGWNGNMDTAIAIRTAVIADGELHIQAGAGIVADSVPAQEWQETMNKGRAIFRAVAMTVAGLDPGALED
ncbi:MAG TPA: anthranilate synthase component I [Gammaproteobacteria bacterium]|mgnify:FL=1|jgi:anthranilate synthase component 1|nr:anthranilate synthase component I [Acidiferrobacteraceae bacterium]MDP6551914.1 anthranilate synthase component I [Arenicellales bacterium]MDP6791361.1 anthranilate synthase component I [Arenicellales bacterium]MDP6919318.1 anthranilate synthase component I [Arenicellales bacterium]HCX88244.1 anthranilate synthase component I [Gammaproteobacteria bacterium]|tara:strand:- start:32941 stop:34434 length:1494 start_codon:yes stop_codon:yes gene_type:complete